MKKVLPALSLLALLLAVGWLGLTVIGPAPASNPPPAPSPPPLPAADRPAPSPPLSPVPAGAPAPAPPVAPEIEAARSEARALESAGDLAGAAALIEETLQQFPSDQLLARELSRLYDARGWKNHGARDLRAARGFFKEALFYWPGNQEALRGLAVVSVEEQDRASAEEWIRQYFVAGGDRPEVYALQGRIAYEDERLAEAMYYFEASLALAPRQPETIAMLEKISRELKVESQFQRRDSRHFVIKYEGRELPEAWRVVEAACEDAYLEVGRRLGHYPRLPVTVILYTDRQFQDATRVPAWAEAIFDGKIRIPAKGLGSSSDELTRIVRHEYAHAVVHDLSRGRAPIWLHEGVAQIHEGSATDPAAIARRVVGSGGPLPLASIEGMFVNLPQARAELAYVQSRLAAIYLTESQGPFVLRELLRRLGEGATVAEAVRGATGKSYPDLDADFKRWVERLAGG